MLSGCHLRPLLSDVSVTPAVISPNADGTDDATNIAYKLSRNANVSIYFMNSGGDKFYFRQDRRRSPGPYQVQWGGVINQARWLEMEDGAGRQLVESWVLPDGTYTWVVEATDDGGQIEQTFQVGDAPQLTIDNFAGDVTLVGGQPGAITVVAVKHAPFAANLDRIEVILQPQAGGLLIETRKPSTMINAWVTLNIRAPAGTVLDLKTGSGNVEVSGIKSGAKVHTGSGNVVAHDMTGGVDLQTGSGSVSAVTILGSLQVDTGSGRVDVEGVVGEINARTGSGGMDVRTSAGPVRLETGSGGINYQGTPEGDCRFQTGSGGISLRVPADLNAQVDLHTGSGSIDVGFPVVGNQSRQDVKGAIGSGGDTTIWAQTGSGSISLVAE
jgi:hypothetical protein